MPFIVFGAFGRPFEIHGVAGWSLLLASAALTILLAFLSFKYFEQPLISFGHRWKYRKRERSPYGTDPRANFAGRGS
jgi:peptidoglycan/LPS O-acetylase OafA/YrhL